MLTHGIILGGGVSDPLYLQVGHLDDRDDDDNKHFQVAKTFGSMDKPENSVYLIPIRLPYVLHSLLTVPYIISGDISLLT